MTKIILFSVLVLSPFLTQAAQLTCDYGYAGVSMGTIKVSVDSNNTIKSTLHNPAAPAGAKEMQGLCTTTTL